jgi:hypothetical protein
MWRSRALGATSLLQLRESWRLLSREVNLVAWPVGSVVVPDLVEEDAAAAIIGLRNTLRRWRWPQDCSSPSRVRSALSRRSLSHQQQPLEGLEQSNQGSSSASLSPKRSSPDCRTEARSFSVALRSVTHDGCSELLEVLSHPSRYAQSQEARSP